MKREDQPQNPSPPAQPAPAPRAPIAVGSPAALAYKRQLEARRAVDLRGGGASPPIPRLDQPHQDGMTMADQAVAQMSAYAPQQQFQQPPSGPSIFGPGGMSPSAAQPPQGILNGDVLPNQAKEDSAFLDGHGSMVAMNQPNLAMKYGVIRNGRHIPPQQLNAGRPGLKQETLDSLKAVVDFNAHRKEVESGDHAAEKAAESGLAGEAAKIANSAGSNDVRPVTQDQRDEVTRAMKNMDEFDFNAFREIMMKDLVNNEEQRKIVEERLQPLDITQLIVENRITQRVPIIPDKYEPTFQSFTGEEELALKRLVMEERKGVEAPDRYMLEKFQLMTVALCTVQINSNRLLPHLDAKGDFSDDLFWKKFNQVMKLPFHMLASMGVHFYWYDIRVRKLFVAERIKGF